MSEQKSPDDCHCAQSSRLKLTRKDLQAEKEVLEKRVAELEKAVDYYERDGAMMKKAPIEMVNKILEFEALKQDAEALAGALEEAKRIIEGEYCSHEQPHGKDNAECYTNFIYRVLTAYRAKHPKEEPK